MEYFIAILVIYLASIGINAWFIHYKDKSHKVWKIAFDMWKDTLPRDGYPRHESGAWMTYWELVDYFDEKCEKKKIYIDHVNRNWSKCKNFIPSKLK